MIFLGLALFLSDAAITYYAGRYLDARDTWRQTGIGRKRVVELGAFHALLGGASVLLLIDIGWWGLIWTVAGVAFGEYASTRRIV